MFVVWLVLRFFLKYMCVSYWSYSKRSGTFDMLQVSILLMLGRQDESLRWDFTEGRPSDLDIIQPFLSFTFPRTLLLTGLLVISTGHSFFPVISHMSPFSLFIVKPTFLWWISVGFNSDLLGQELHSACMSRSCGEVAFVTKGIRSCVNQMLVFSLVWTKFNCNPRMDWDLPNEQVMLL